MMLSLSTKSKLGFIDGNIIIHDLLPMSLKLRKNIIIWYVLICRLTWTWKMSQKKSFIFKSAREIWVILEGRFGLIHL